MAEGRAIRCDFHEPPKWLYIPESWSADYAMAWFHAEHLGLHVDEMTSEAFPVCRTCQRIIRNDAPVHRPCFDPDCFCDCSHTTTTERTAHADG